MKNCANTESRVNREKHKTREKFSSKISGFVYLAYFAVKRRSFFILFILFILSKTSQAQTQQAWVAHYNNGITKGTNQALKMALDATGNIYVTGSSQNANTNLGYVTIKYAPNGHQLWVARYDSINYPNATPSGLVLDKDNNVIVTGNALTVKYDPNGNQLWTAPYAGTALAVDSNAYIYVTGFGTQFNTVKLSPSGNSQWQTTYSDVGPTLSQAVLVDSNNNIYITGSDQYSEGFDDDYVQLDIVKYDTNGVMIWMATDSNPATGSISVKTFAIDGGGNLYIEANLNSGGPSAGGNIYIFANNGNLVAQGENPNIDSSDTQGAGMVLDSATNVLITGTAEYVYNDRNHTDSNCSITFKINLTDAAMEASIWTSDYPQPPAGNGGANAIAVDPANNVYVTGFFSTTKGSNSIIATVKYNGNGNQAWVQSYSSPGNGNAAGNAIAVDRSGDVYVTGYDTPPRGGTEIVTIKYALVPIQLLTDGDVLLQAQGLSGENFDVQASTNLHTWVDLGTNAADTNGLFQFTDTNAPSNNVRFYVPIPQ